MAGVSVDLAPVQAAIAAACERAGRAPDEVELLAATKYVDVDDVGLLIEAGVPILGENRAQALEEKAAAWGGRERGLRWHFIGQLQSRKVKTILPLVELVHSVASESVLAQLDKHGSDDTKVLVQVDLAGEETKSGIAPGELASFIRRCPVEVVGLMTMPPAVQDPEDNRPLFRELGALADEHGLHHRSMGTSQDYVVAVEEGATIVRVGSALFTRS
jgi:PLP dependent protein